MNRAPFDENDHEPKEARISLPLLIHEVADTRWVWPVLAIVAWFIQMGLHEGGHAYAADRMGDTLPRMYGKVSFNPLRHIDWNNSSYVLGAVVLPIVTAFTFLVPMGMAYVMVSRGTTAHDAKVALAGPIGSFVAALLGVVWVILWWPAIQAEVISGHTAEILIFFGIALTLVSTVYGVFNLIPLPPLDGGTIAYHYLNNDGRRFFDAIRPYGFFILIGIFWILPLLTNDAVNPSRDIFLPVVDFAIEYTIKPARALWGPIGAL